MNINAASPVGVEWKGNEFKQRVDLYEYLLHVEGLHRQDKVNMEEGEKLNFLHSTGASRAAAAALCSRLRQLCSVTV